MQTSKSAYDQIPSDAVWSCSFGNPGEGGFVEYYRTPSGERWQIKNGSFDLPSFALDWSCSRMEG